MFSLGLGIENNARIIVAVGGGTPTATLTTGIGGAGSTGRCQFIDATAYQAIVNTVVGAACLDRATSAASTNTKFQVEINVNHFGYQLYMGFDDGSQNLASAINNAHLPGNAAGGGAPPGIMFAVNNTVGGSYFTANGTLSTLSATSTISGTTVFDLTVDNTTPAAPVVKLLQGGTLIQSVTLSSQIPSSWRLIVGGYAGDGTVGGSDAVTVNFGNTAFTYPQAGFGNYL